jgi:hypothetical protein
MVQAVEVLSHEVPQYSLSSHDIFSYLLAITRLLLSSLLDNWQ